MVTAEVEMNRHQWVRDIIRSRTDGLCSWLDVGNEERGQSTARPRFLVGTSGFMVMPFTNIRKRGKETGLGHTGVKSCEII